MTFRYFSLATAILLSACGHPEPFDYSAPTLGPANSGSDVRLTFNSDEDYWPIWTEDGAGILYAFADRGTNVLKRCIGLLPAAGGTRLWQLCDNRSTEVDSANAFVAYALGSDGRLLYLEGATSVRSTLNETTLWLADTAHPFSRTAALKMPVILSGITYNTLGDIRWTGPTTFLALAQIVETFAHCKACGAQDTLLTDRGIVVSGSIAGGQATLVAISGTTGASGYSPAEGGASIVFTRPNDTHLFKVASTGGTATTVTNVVATSGQQLTGVSCKASTCVVATDAVTLADPTGPFFPSIGNGPNTLNAVSLTTGVVQQLKSSPSGLLSAPQISPSNGDVVVQVGGFWGHLQSFFGGAAGELHLYPALVP